MALPSFATDDDYGATPVHPHKERDPSKPIRLDELEGAVPESEHDGDTLELCLQCTLPLTDCVCGGGL